MLLYLHLVLQLLLMRCGNMTTLLDHIGRVEREFVWSGYD